MLKEFFNKKGKRNIEQLSAKFGTVSSAESTAVSGPVFVLFLVLPRRLETYLC